MVYLMNVLNVFLCSNIMLVDCSNSFTVDILLRYCWHNVFIVCTLWSMFIFSSAYSRIPDTVIKLDPPICALNKGNKCSYWFWVTQYFPLTIVFVIYNRYVLIPNQGCVVLGTRTAFNTLYLVLRFTQKSHKYIIC